MTDNKHGNTGRVFTQIQYTQFTPHKISHGFYNLKGCYMKLEKIPLGLLCLFTIKLLILNTWSFESAMVLLALAGLTGLFQFKANYDQYQEIKNTLIKQTEYIADLQKQNESIRNSISGMKMAAGVKSQGMKF